MIQLTTTISQQFTSEQLPAAVRAAIGQPLRRAPALAQLAVLGALACLPAHRRHLPTALFWQTVSGPRQNTLLLLNEIGQNDGEAMPFTFLATVPVSAAVHLRPFIPGLCSTTMLPLENENSGNWSLLLALAKNTLKNGHAAQVLCAHLDHWADQLSGHWLCLQAETRNNDGEPAVAILRPVSHGTAQKLADHPHLPARVAAWLQTDEPCPLRLDSPAAAGLAVEFARP